MRRAVVAALATYLLVTPLATAHPAAAGSMMRGMYIEEFDGTTPFGAGENMRVDYAGTQHEVRAGSYALMAPGTGPRSAGAQGPRGNRRLHRDHAHEARGRTQLRGQLLGAGRGWLTDPDTDTFRVAHLRLHGRLAGSAGTSVVFEGTFKLTLKPDGTAVVDRQSSTCG